VDAFHFEKTYGGLFVGYPKNQTGYIRQQEKKAQAMSVPDAFYTVPPAVIIREDGPLKYESWPWTAAKRV
jgi:hypothetical protein